MGKQFYHYPDCYTADHEHQYNKFFCFQFNGTTWKKGSTTWQILSDRCTKTNIMPYTLGLSEQATHPSINYHYKSKYGNSEIPYVGLIAQDVEQVIHSMIHIDSQETHGIKDLKSVDSGELTYMLINAIKILKQEVDTLKQEVDTLKKQIAHPH